MPRPAPLLPRLALITAALLGASSAHAAGEDRLRTTVEGAIRPLMAQHDIPGMAVGVVVDGRASVFNFGVMSLKSQAPVTGSTRFEVGSVSKTFTALLTAYAQSTGKLSLDDHPGRHVPALRGSPIDRATLLHLTTYTAGGLPLQFPDGVSADDAAALAWLRGWQPEHAPGAVRRYSNPSMGLLGLATANALGQDFATAVETQLFPAFGMAHSHVRMPASAMPDYAWGHRGGTEVRMQPGPLGDPSYGVRTTAADLLRFVQSQIDPQALPPALRRAVEDTQRGRFRVGPMVQALGWDQAPWPVSREWLLGGNAVEMSLQPQPAQRVADAAPDTPRLFGKTGGTGGFAAYVAFVPSQRVGLVMLANRNHPIPDRIEAAWSILRAITPGD